MELRPKPVVAISVALVGMTLILFDVYRKRPQLRNGSAVPMPIALKGKGSLPTRDPSKARATNSIVNRAIIRNTYANWAVQSVDGFSGELTPEFLKLWAFSPYELETCQSIFRNFYQNYCRYELASAELMQSDDESWIRLSPLKEFEPVMHCFEKNMVEAFGESRGIGASSMIVKSLREGGATTLDVSFTFDANGRPEVEFRHIDKYGTWGGTFQGPEVKRASFMEMPRWRHLQTLTGDPR